MKEILKFKDSDIELCLFIDNGKLVYAKRDKENISYQVADSQKELINKVLFELLPSNNVKDLGYIKYVNKEIRHLYDMDNNFHIFYEGEYEITEDCLKLNNIYNNQEEYLTLIENKRKNVISIKRSESRYTRRNVKIGKRVISVIVMSTVLLSTSLLYIKGLEKVVNLVKNHRYEQKVREYADRQIQVDEIINAINNNKKLKEEEKEFFLSHKEFFYNQLEYLDYYTVLDNLNKLYIEYVPEKCQNRGVYADFTWYGEDKGRLRVYESTCFTDAPKFAMSHEFIHTFTKHSNNFNYFYEILNVTLNNEYFGSDVPLYDNGYADLRNYFYIIAELIDPEILRKYHANTDINYLINPLMEIIPDNDMAVNLLLNIDSICRISLLAGEDPDSYEKLSTECQLKCKEIESSLKTYYETKYQVSIADDSYALFCFNQAHGITKIAADMNLELNAYLHADKFSSIKQLKKVFNKTGNDNLTLHICNQVNEVVKYYTLEEVLNGDTGFLYRTKEGIDLPLMEDGTYKGVTYEPLHYIDYEVLSYQDKLNFNRNR